MYEAGLRFEKALDSLRRATDKDLIIVSHSGVIRAMLCRMFGMSINDYMKFGSANLSVTILQDVNGILLLERFGYVPTELLTDERIRELYVRYHVPDNIIRHMKATAAYIKELLDSQDSGEKRFAHNLLIKAALVHEIARTQPMHDVQGARILMREGFYEIAELVEVHHQQ